MNGRLQNLLVVESNPADAYLTAEALKQAGLTSAITVFDDGERALAHLEQASTPDMIFLDLNLTPMSGLDVLKRVRADPRLCAIPVIVMSGSVNARDVHQSYANGANCYITKPTTLDEFLRIMKSFYDFWGSAATLPPRSA